MTQEHPPTKVAALRGESVAEPLARRFYERAAERLLAAPSAGDGAAAGDHLLNPSFAEDATSRLRDAAVLIPVVAQPRPTVLFTQRTIDLRSHAGEISFPGGKIDASDEGPAAAALREAEEEIGLQPESREVIGYLDTYLSRTGYRIFPVVARVAPDYQLTINRAEVADVFPVPLSFLLDGANYRRGNRNLGGRQAHFYEIPYGERYIWGVTAGIVRTLYDRMVD